MFDIIRGFVLDVRHNEHKESERGSLMRLYVTVFTLIFSLTGAPISYAYDDGFGDRFYNNAPSGLGDHNAEEEPSQDIAMDDLAESLQDIQPAAGDEEQDIEAEEAEQ